MGDRVGEVLSSLLLEHTCRMVDGVTIHDVISDTGHEWTLCIPCKWRVMPTYYYTNYI